MCSQPIFYIPLLTTFFLLAFSSLQAQEPPAVANQFRNWDKNSDGKLSRDELPEQARQNFSRVDTNRDGSIDLSEHSSFVNRNAKNKAIETAANIHRDIAYVENGHERHKLDLYLPTNATKGNALPLIIWIHGGGWRNGSKDNCPAAPYVKSGFAVASINYRLSSHAIFPAQIHDCKAAIRFLRKNAEQYGIDPKRFGVWGSSAGGHLVALVGTSGDVSELEGNLGVQGVSSRVQAVCDYFGPTDLLKMSEQSDSKSKLDHNAKDSPESLLVGGPLQETCAAAESANPIKYVSKDDPPFLIVHGDSDPLVPHQQSQMLEESLKKTGVRSKLTIIPGGGHGPFREPEQLKAVETFFEEILEPTESSK